MARITLKYYDKAYLHGAGERGPGGSAPSRDVAAIFAASPNNSPTMSAPNSAESPIPLTQFSRGSGCGCKLAPDLLDRILRSDRAHVVDPRLLVGPATKDDAAIYDMDGDQALISTVDFFTPIVDDARLFGRIARRTP